MLHELQRLVGPCRTKTAPLGADAFEEIEEMPSTPKTAVLLGTLVVALFSSFASAQTGIPSLAGTWSGTITGGYRAGELEHSAAEKHPKNAAGIARTLVIEKQDGSGFIGTWGSNTKREALIGVIRADNKTILMVDDDTNFVGTLQSPDTMEMCVQEHGVARIAVCALLRRK